jgi:glycosyltransferase involved in cell wall biosynthesis
MDMDDFRARKGKAQCEAAGALGTNAHRLRRPTIPERGLIPYFVGMRRPLLVVSAWVDSDLRKEIAAGNRPRAEFLELEREHGFELLDWSQLGGRKQRSGMLSLRHAAAVIPKLRDHGVVFSDGEHVGIPLALAMAFGPEHPHVMIGHRLTTPKKRVFFRVLKAYRRMTRIIVHSRTQLEAASRQLGIPRARLEFIPYSADAEFWRPLGIPEECLIASAGREHRDYAVLDRACEGLGQRLFIAAGSLHSPGAPCTLPPSTSQAVVRQLDHVNLRDLYARAAVVVVPLIPNDFQAGVTTLLEAMAMGKAVVVSSTEGQRDIVIDGETGVLVPPGDESALHSVLARLLADPAERSRLGRNARHAVEERYSLERYVESLATTIRGAAA